MNIGPTVFLETSVRNHHYTLRNIAEEHKCLLCGESLESHTVQKMKMYYI